MRKFTFFAAMALLSSAVMATEVATFENEEGGIQATETQPWLGGADAEGAIAGAYPWQSGDFAFYTYMDNSWGAAYYYAFYVSADPANTSTGWTEPYRSASGGAFAGKNFAVWYNDYYGTNGVSLSAAQVVPGFFVNNNAYTVNSMVNGDGIGKAFEANDYLKLIISGKREGVDVDAQVVFPLAAEGKYVNQWTFVDLSSLGEVDEIIFSLDGSDVGDYGLNTPAYFCLDEFGATMPAGYIVPEMAAFPQTPVQTVLVNEPARKMIIDGRILIVLPNGRTVDMLGQVER